MNLVRVCPQCRRLIEEGYNLTPVSIDRYLEAAKLDGRKKKDCCDQCRKKSPVMACFSLEVKRRT